MKAIFSAAALTSIAGLACFAGPGLGFPLVGIAAGQAVRLHVVNLTASAPGAQSGCDATLKFIDATGREIRQDSVRIAAGQSQSLELKRSDLPGNGQRAEVRAVLLFGQRGGAAPPTIRTSDCGNLFPSLEVYDTATGKTSVTTTETKELPEPLLVPPIP